MANKKLADEMAEIIKARITEHQDAIRLLEIELSRYVVPSSGRRNAARRIGSDTLFPDKGSNSKRASIKERVIAAIKGTTDPYKIEELRKIVNADGGDEISKPTFTSTHSRLAGKHYVQVSKGLKNKPAIYKKVDK